MFFLFSICLTERIIRVNDESVFLGAYTAEEFFNRLKDFIKDLDHEEKRTVYEGLTEEELATFDLMVHDLPLDEKERNQVKAIAKELITKMQDLLVIDWRKKQRTKARVRNAVEDILDDLPETYDDKLWPKTCSEVFMHIFEKYPGQGKNIYNQ
ncbi:MAG: DUF3387 domain-containing protein [Gammaproteobacteria bacterium]|nr:DUF3387 domain-containing protein [Gammaproteobacteria bacterium]